MHALTPSPSAVTQMRTFDDGDLGNEANFEDIHQRFADRIQDNTNKVAALETQANTAETNAELAVNPGHWAGKFTGTGSMGSLHMLTLSEDDVAGQSSTQTSLEDYDSGAQTDKLLLLPADCRVMVTFDVLVAVDSGTDNVSELRVQSSTTDDFASPTTRFISKTPMFDLGGTARYARHQMSRSFTVGASPIYLRFLLQQPTGEAYTLDADCNSITVVWIGID